MKNTDLHTHSYYSDGANSPKQLVRLAKKKKIKNLALTDHNSVKGIKEAIAEAKKSRINIIPAVEIVCYKGEILSYYIDTKNKELKKLLKISREKIQNKVKETCKLLQKRGYKITFKEIKKKFPKANNNYNSFYPVEMLIQKGYAETRDAARKIRKSLKQKELKLPTLIRAIKIVRKADGIPVLAHPWVEHTNYLFKNMKKFVKAGLKGIEINNGDTSPFKKKGIAKKIRRIAKKYNLILTSGSDYHGKKLLEQMPGNHELGKNNCDEKIVKEIIRFKYRSF